MNYNKLLDLLLEDFDLNDEIIQINEILLNEENKINIIDNNLKNEKIKKSDETSNEVTNLLNLDIIADKIENKNTSNSNLNVTIEKEDNKLLKVDIYPDDDFDEDDESLAQLNITLKNVDNNLNTLNVNIDNNKKDDNTIDVNIDNEKKDNNTIDVNIDNNKKDSNTIDIKLKSDDKDAKELDLKVVDTSTAKETGAPGEILIKLKTYDEEIDDKTTEFIKKRDELLRSKDPNFQLSTSLKIIVQLKDSLERLISHIPNETILARTKYLLGNMLDQIMDNSSLILKDKEKIKEIIYKIFSMIISINDYITKQYIKLEDKLDNTAKKEDDKLIKNSIKKIEKNIKDKENNNFSDNQETSQDTINEKIKKTPNINRKKI